MLMDAEAWRLLFVDRPKRPGLFYAVRLRWILESVNSLLPAAQVGGEFLRARLASFRGIPLAVTGAAATVDVTVGSVTQALFALIGIGGLAAHVADADNGLLLALSCGLAAFAALIWLFFWFQKAGPGRIVAGLVRRISRRSSGPSGSELDRAINQIYAERKILVAAFFWRLLAWLVGAGEIWIALWALGAPVSVWDAIILESTLQLVRGVAFIVPAALGVQEGALLGLGIAFGLTAETGLALSLVRRVRDLAIGIPGLIFWQISEGFFGLRRRRR
jgi:putative membrane protein